MGKFYHSMNILDLPATIQLGKIWRRQSTTEMLKRKENSSVPVFKQDLQKPGKCFTVIKNCIPNTMIKTGFFLSKFLPF